MRFVNSFFQYFPSFKGKIRLAKIYHKNIIKKNEDVSFNLPIGLKITVPNLIENVSFELFINGNYEKEIVDYFVKTIPQNGVFFDIGANIGAFSFTLAKLRPDIKIYAFEAAPFVFQYLKKNIEQNNLNNVYIFNKAVHKTEGLKLPFYSSKEKNGKGSFSKVFTEEAVEVETINLDKFIKNNNLNPTVFKVDVEGYEKLIFESLEEYFTNNKNLKVLFEFVDWAEELSNIFKPGDAQAYIKSLGFNLSELKNKSTTPYIDILTKGSINVLATK